MNPVRKGALAELKACSWLIEQGYEVFRNVSPEGPFDLIAVKPGETIYVDVKLCCPRKDFGVYVLGAGALNPSVKKYQGLNIKKLFVYDKYIAWSLLEVPFDGDAYEASL